MLEYSFFSLASFIMLKCSLMMFLSFRTAGPVCAALGVRLLTFEAVSVISGSRMSKGKSFS